MRIKIGDKVSVINEERRGKVVSRNAQEIFVEDEDGFIFQYAPYELTLYDDALYETTILDSTKQEGSASRKNFVRNKKDVASIDLHFDALVAAPNAFTAQERMAIQRDFLIEQLNALRRAGHRKIEIIHGLGSGVVQQMVEDVLQFTYSADYHHTEIIRAQSASIIVYF